MYNNSMVNKKILFNLLAGFFLIILMTNLISAATWDNSLNVGLLAYYTMDDAYVTGVASSLKDSITGTHNWTLYNKSSYGNTGATGLLGTSINTTGFWRAGVMNTQSNPINLNPNITGTYTISLWQNSTNFNSNIFFPVYTPMITPYPYGGIGLDATHVYFDFICNAANVRYTYTGTIPTNRWILYTMVANGTDLLGYINGTYKGKITCTKPSNYGGWGWSLGQNNVVGMNGLVDEVGFWNRALSATEISNLYNNGLGITYIPNTDPCAPPTSGNWVIDCSQNCTWNTPSNIPGNITTSNIGIVYLDSWWHFISAKSYFIIKPGCNFILNSRGKLI